MVEVIETTDDDAEIRLSKTEAFDIRSAAFEAEADYAEIRDMIPSPTTATSFVTVQFSQSELTDTVDCLFAASEVMESKEHEARARMALRLASALTDAMAKGGIWRGNLAELEAKRLSANC